MIVLSAVNPQSGANQRPTSGSATSIRKSVSPIVTVDLVVLQGVLPMVLLLDSFLVTDPW